MCRLDKPGKRLPNKFEEPDLYEISRRFPLPELTSSSTSEHNSSDSNSLVAFSLSSSGDQHPPTTFGLDPNKSQSKFGALCLRASPATSAPQTVSRRSSENQLSQGQISSQKESNSLQGELKSSYLMKHGQMPHQEKKPACTSDPFSWESSRFGQGLTEYSRSKDKSKYLLEYEFLAASGNRRVRQLYSRTSDVYAQEKNKVLREQECVSSSRENLKHPCTNNIPFHQLRRHDGKQFDKQIIKHTTSHSFRQDDMNHYPRSTAQDSFTYSSEGSIYGALEHQCDKNYQVLQQSAHEYQNHLDLPSRTCEYEGRAFKEHYARSSCGLNNDATAADEGSYYQTNEKNIDDPAQRFYEKQDQTLKRSVHEYLDTLSYSFKDQGYESYEQHELPSYEPVNHTHATTQGSFMNPKENENQYQVQNKYIRDFTGRIDTYSDPFEHQMYESRDHCARSSSELDHPTAAAEQVTFKYDKESQHRHHHVQDPQHCVDMHGTEFGHQGYEPNEHYIYDTFGLDHPPHQKHCTYGYQPHVQALCDGANSNRSLPVENSFGQLLAEDDAKVVNTPNNLHSLSSSLNDSFLEFDPSPSMFDEK